MLWRHSYIIGCHEQIVGEHDYWHNVVNASRGLQYVLRVRLPRAFVINYINN